MTVPRLVGMVHLKPLPGSPGFDGGLPGVIERAIGDATTLADAGFDALMIENYGDTPFFASHVPAITVAAMTAVVSAVASRISIPFGVNVLRNDARGAVAIAAVTGAAFIRVNVLVGTMFTDQGVIEGQAADVVRDIAVLAPGLAVFADVFVKHAVAPGGLTVSQAALDTFERGGATALIVSGSGTGQPVDIEVASAVRETVPQAPLLIGSGATATSVAALLTIADGVIVGSSLKQSLTDPIDPALARAFVSAAS